jgi:hypothetical protein
MDTSTSGTARAATFDRRTVLHRWPSVLGLAIAVESLVTGTDRKTVAVVVCVAALCYLGAAALSRPWVAWAGTIGGSVVVAVGEEMGRLALLTGIGIAAFVLIVAGVIRRIPRSALTAQTAALAGYGGIAAAALFFAPRLGLALAGVALAAHAGWDLIHYRRNQVVPRSLSEFCMLLDVPLGIGAVVLAIVD